MILWNSDYCSWSGVTYDVTSKRWFVCCPASWTIIRVLQDHTLLIEEWFDLLHILICCLRRFQQNFDIQYNTVPARHWYDILCFESTGFAGFSWIWTWIIRQLDVIGENGKNSIVFSVKNTFIKILQNACTNFGVV